MRAAQIAIAHKDEQGHTDYLSGTAPLCCFL